MLDTHYPLKRFCTLCGSTVLKDVYSLEQIPAFQNKVYTQYALAIKVPKARLCLKVCHHCQFVFNAAFQSDLMDYDGHYQNEQAHSPRFKEHLDDVVDLFKIQKFQDLRGIEVGCGKGYFLEYLNKNGFDIIGYDPAYTGDNKRIIKSYFKKQDIEQKVDFIILRHVLEHVEHPRDFLMEMSNVVNEQAQIYVEIPALEWILENHAFWDIFHEHCNYFSTNSINSIFKKVTQGRLFGGQYLYFITSLEKDNFKTTKSPVVNSNFINLTNKIAHYREHIGRNKNLYLWGAGAKGVTFANIVDPDNNIISGLIDINPEKQGKFIGMSGHKIYSPAIVNHLQHANLLVMNDIYYEEIKRSYSNPNVTLIKLSDIQ